MIFIFGSRRNRRNIGQLIHACPGCRQNAYFTYVRFSSWFTLFFIPCIPLGSNTIALCNMCGFQQPVQNAWADQAIRAEAQRLAAAPPYR